MESSNALLLNRIFTRNTFRQIIDEGESSAYVTAIQRYINNRDGMTNRECISKIYQILKSEYRNEYYYKNTLLNKLLLGIHSPRTTTALTEVPIANSKADFILINGKAVVYEIKTELDNFERLTGQLADYYKAFSRVIVVTSESHYLEVQKRLTGTPTGICILTKKGTLSMRKEPSEYTESFSKSVMFKILRKEEYERINFNTFGELPKVSQFEYYRANKALFESLRIDIAYKKFIEQLKCRSNVEIDLYKQIPYELKFLVYFSNYRPRDYFELGRFLDK